MTFAFQTWQWIAGDHAEAEEPAPAPEATPAPVCCPEVWRTVPIDPLRAWDAVKALCGG
jgi:hypothetical protein